MPRPLLEICVDELPLLRRAAAGGADRIELCADLGAGGLSPSTETVRAAREATDLPVFVMIRPRQGDFHYGPTELARMVAEIEDARAAGADGLVLGALTERGEIDEPAVRRLVAAAAGLPVTFHRAFDATPDPERALETLVALGVARVLTAGHAPSAPAGAATLARLVRRAADRLIVMPGGGVRAANAGALAEATGAHELHSSAGGAEGLAAGELAALRAVLARRGP